MHKFKAFNVNLRRLSGWKTPRRASGRGSKVKSMRFLVCFRSRKQSFSVHCHLRHLRGTLKIVFQLKLLNARASPRLREPDNLRSFVSSSREGDEPKRPATPRRGDARPSAISSSVLEGESTSTQISGARSRAAGCCPSSSAAYLAEIHAASITLTPSDVTTGVSASALPAGKWPCNSSMILATWRT